MALQFEFSVEDVIGEKRTTRTNIDEIRKWMDSSNLPKIQDEQILLFLLACDNVIKDTQTTISAFYKYRNLAPEFFSERDMDTTDLKHISSIVDTCVIPKRTKDNYFIILGRLKNTSYWNFHLEPAIKYLFMTFGSGMRKNPPNGLIVIFDMKGVGLMHLTKLRVGPLRKFFHFVQEALPCQLRSIHFFNSVYFVDKLIAIVRPFMKKELYDMLHFHPSSLNMAEFNAEWIEEDCLPEDYGGKQPSVTKLTSATLDNLYSLNDFFAIEEEQRKHYTPPR